MTVVVDPDLSPESGVVLDELIARVRRELVDREAMNLLADTIGLNETALRFVHSPENMTRGTLLSIDEEIMYVWSVDVGNRSAVVERGWDGEASEHDGNARVNIGGLSRSRIIDAINDELSSLSASGLFQMKSTPLATLGIYGLNYPVPAALQSNVYDVQWQETTASAWTRFPGWRYSSIDASLSFRELPPFGQFRVLYKSPFTPIRTGANDVQATTGLHSEANDILVWGACYRLTGGDEYKRNDFRTQGDTRRADEVPYRALALARQDYRQMREDRLSEERTRLSRFFPTIRPGW